MADKETGGRAFPWCGNLNDAPTIGLGMTLRDYFAAKALLGWLAGYPETSSHPVVAGNEDKVAQEAYQMADAMLAARSK